MHVYTSNALCDYNNCVLKKLQLQHLDTRNKEPVQQYVELVVAYYMSWHGLHVQLDALSLPLPAHALLVMACRLVVRTCLCLPHPQQRAISDERSVFQILVLEVLQKVTHFSGGHLVW